MGIKKMLKWSTNFSSFLSIAVFLLQLIHKEIKTAVRFFFLSLSCYFLEFSFYRCLWGLSSLIGFIKSYDVGSLSSPLLPWTKWSLVKFCILILRRNLLCSFFSFPIYSSFSVFSIKGHDSRMTALLQLQLLPGSCNCSLKLPLTLKGNHKHLLLLSLSWFTICCWHPLNLSTILKIVP